MVLIKTIFWQLFPFFLKIYYGPIWDLAIKFLFVQRSRSHRVGLRIASLRSKEAFHRRMDSWAGFVVLSVVLSVCQNQILSVKIGIGGLAVHQKKIKKRAEPRVKFMWDCWCFQLIVEKLSKLYQCLFRFQMSLKRNASEINETVNKIVNW